MLRYVAPCDTFTWACSFQTLSSLWSSLETPYMHSYGRWALCHFTVICNLYVVAGRSYAVYAVGTAEAFCMVKARIHFLTGSYVECGMGLHAHGCYELVAAYSNSFCCMTSVSAMTPLSSSRQRCGLRPYRGHLRPKSVRKYVNSL